MEGQKHLSAAIATRFVSRTNEAQIKIHFQIIITDTLHITSVSLNRNVARSCFSVNSSTLELPSNFISYKVHMHETWAAQRQMRAFATKGMLTWFSTSVSNDYIAYFTRG